MPLRRRDRPDVERAVAEPVLGLRADLGESPVWSPRDDRLYWVDIDARQVHRTDPSDGTDEVRHVAGRPGSIALTTDAGRLLVAAERSLWTLDWPSAELTEAVRLEPETSRTRLNDGRCDRTGRFWVGSMDDPADSGADAARLHRVDLDMTTTVAGTGIAISNTLAFDAAGTTMYWADTPRGVVWAYDYDADDGRRTGARVLVDFATALPGAPDGACVDESDCLWIACVYGWSVARISPRGDVDRIVGVPVEKPSMPAFGGQHLDVMYVTSIRSGGARPAAPDQPLAGALLALDVGQRGLPEPTFAG